MIATISFVVIAVVVILGLAYDVLRPKTKTPPPVANADTVVETSIKQPPQPPGSEIGKS
jgi:hypothetical protein